MPYQQDCEIVSLRALNARAFEMILEAGAIAREAQPGQFVNLSCGEGHLLRRPISICEAVDTRLRLVFEVRGAGTAWLAARSAGEKISVLGPLGHGFDTKGKRVLLIGGGIGVPPLLWAAKQAAHADAALGFAAADRAILTEDFEKVCTALTVTTDDGSLGRKGNALDGARTLLEHGRYDTVCVCGPKILLNYAAQAAQAAGIPCQVSMEERMGCGVGACLVCAVKLRDAQGETYYGHVCKDGPVFSSEEVVFDD